MFLASQWFDNNVLVLRCGKSMWLKDWLSFVVATMGHSVPLPFGFPPGIWAVVRTNELLPGWVLQPLRVTISGEQSLRAGGLGSVCFEGLLYCAGS